MRVEFRSSHPYQAVVASPLPHTPYLGLRIADRCLTSIDFIAPEAIPGAATEYRAFCARLRSYFTVQPVEAEVPLRPFGTPFQQRVWQRLKQIPTGEVMTYGELAGELNSSARAVAGACRANPIPILIPCHRVISADGMGGYMGRTAGQALEIKLWLLQHEGYVKER